MELRCPASAKFIIADYAVTLSNVIDCANHGSDPTIGVVVHNSGGGNLCALATQVDDGVYTFPITLTTQCLAMPIEVLHERRGSPAGQSIGHGLFRSRFRLAALKLDVYFGFVDSNAFDLCSNNTVNDLSTAACTTLASYGYTPAGNTHRIEQEMLSNCNRRHQ